MKEREETVKAVTAYYPEGGTDVAIDPEHGSGIEVVEVRKGRLVFELPAHGTGKLEASPFCLLCVIISCRSFCGTCVCPEPTCVCTFQCVLTARGADGAGMGAFPAAP